MFAAALVSNSACREEPPLPEPWNPSRNRACGLAEDALEGVPPQVQAWLRDAERVAKDRYAKRLCFDMRDLEALGSIVSGLHNQHAKKALGHDRLQTEVARWGAVCSQIMASRWASHWGAAMEHNLAYGHSLWIAYEGGGSYEDDCFDAAQQYITAPIKGWTLGEHIGLRLLD